MFGLSDDKAKLNCWTQGSVGGTDVGGYTPGGLSRTVGFPSSTVGTYSARESIMLRWTVFHWSDELPVKTNRALKHYLLTVDLRYQAIPSLFGEVHCLE